MAKKKHGIIETFINFIFNNLTYIQLINLKQIRKTYRIEAFTNINMLKYLQRLQKTGSSVRDFNVNLTIMFLKKLALLFDKFS